MLAVITSCRRRLPELSFLLADLHASDWDWPVLVTMDTEAVEHAGQLETIPDRRSNENFRLAIRRAVAAGVPWFVLLEDDSEVNRHLAHNLLHWEPLTTGLMGCGGLSTNGGNRLSFGEGPNWYTPDSRLVYGLQGAVMTRTFAQFLLEHWDDIPANCDLKVARLAGSNQAGRYYKHWPSLVRHRHEVPSVCAHGVITTEGWDKDFRCRRRLEVRYEHLIRQDDHIRAHLPRLRALAARCQSVIEFGVHRGGSTTALLAGLADAGGGSLTAVDSAGPNEHVADLQACARLEGVAFRFVHADCLALPPAACDLLFVDTLHNHEHVAAVLARHASHVRRYLAFHDTHNSVFGPNDDGPGTRAAVLELVAAGGWRVESDWPEDYGLMVLARA